MKIIVIIFAINCVAMQVCSQQKLNDSTIPAQVKSTFKKLYPTTKAEYWTKENESYVAEFDSQKKEMVIFIEPDGKVLKIETRIQPSGLPTNARSYIAKHYPGKKITDTVITKDLEGNRIYEAEVDGLDLVFDGNGKFIKSVIERAVE